MSRFLLLPTLLVLAACGRIPEVDERMQFWNNEVESFFDGERRMDDVHAWLRSHNVIYTYSESDIVDGQWTMTLEKVYLDGWRCDWIDIQINVSMDGTETIQSHDLTQNRACWW